MVDTLYVVNAVQDTLKLVMQSSNNGVNHLQIIMALTTLLAVCASAYYTNKQNKQAEKRA